MPKGVPDGTNKPGWLDIAEFLDQLRGATGVGWCICIAATGRQSKERACLLSVHQFYAGSPVLRDDLALVSAAWPSGSYRDLEAAVLDMLYRLDGRLAEVSARAEQEAFF